MLVLLARPATAADLQAAADALQAEQDRQAATLLIEIIESDSTSNADLATAAWWSRELGNEDLLNRVRAVAETREEQAEAADAHLDVALGRAYLGLAELQLAAGGGSSVALYFADAELRAKSISQSSPAASIWLSARARYAQGDLPGAMTYFEADTRASVDDPAVDALEIQLRYERAAAMPIGADGRPGPDAIAELNRANQLYRQRASADFARVLLPRSLRKLRMVHAWTLHRLGSVAAAERAYLQAYRAGSANLAIRGLQSLHARDATALEAALRSAATTTPGSTAALDTLVQHHLGLEQFGPALLAAQDRLARAQQQPASWILLGGVLRAMGQVEEAARHYGQALEVDPSSDRAAFAYEELARAELTRDFNRGLALYEELLVLRPQDPYARNNLGFILREAVSPYTQMGEAGIQTLRPDAPARARELLIRCRDVYAEAVALIPEAQDESRDLDLSWNLAGIVNDYGLMVHYFADIQDGPKAEALYLRTLRMTENAFKDTYAPNLQRLYAAVLTDRPLAWYRAARRCKDAILLEQIVDGKMVLRPDERKRAAAARDELALRARIVQELREDAETDEQPWPPEPVKRNDR
jgi:tetratricopeptide (TPR) repeat protein